MSKLKLIKQTANVAWSPVQQDEILIATGTAAQQLDATFSTSAELGIYSLDTSSAEYDMPLKGSITAKFRFHSLAWGRGSGEGRGVLAGGMDNGALLAWKADDILSGKKECLLFQNQLHKGPVYSLDFNPFQSNLMASGSTNSEVFIWDLQNPKTPMSPAATTQVISDVTCVRWNKSVQYILCSTNINGSATVWDLRTNRPVISISDPNAMFRCKCVEWNPEIATLLTTASEDDRAPIIRVWDLRNAYSPIQNLEQHGRGVLSMSWCPKDTNMLLSCGKDNRTLIWDPNKPTPNGEVVCELPPNSNWNFNVTWCPRNPSLLSTSSFDGTVGVFSLLGVPPSAQTNQTPGDAFYQVTGSAGGLPLKVAPKWLKRPCGCSFGFGGKLSYFNKLKGSVVSVKNVVTEQDLVHRAHKLQDAIDSHNFLSFCDSKIALLSSNQKLDPLRKSIEINIWKFLKVNFEEDPRLHFLQLLGYDREILAEKISKAALTGGSKLEKVSKLPPQQQSPTNPSTNDSKFDAGAGHISFGQAPNGVNSSNPDDEDIFQSIQPLQNSQPIRSPFKISTKDDINGLLGKALLVGNFEAAVELCLSEDRVAEALILSIAGGQELLTKTQNAYFSNHQSDISRLIGAVVNRDLYDIVQNSSIENWMETLALLCTYARAEEFSTLCEALGDRLEASTNQDARQNAVLCYICAGNIEKMVEYWGKGHKFREGDSASLSDLIEKVSVLRMAMDVDKDHALHDSSVSQVLLSKKYREYANLLASQGCLATALDCLNLSDSQEFEDLVMKDRVFNANGNPHNFQPPPFPFEIVEYFPSNRTAASHAPHQGMEGSSHHPSKYLNSTSSVHSPLQPSQTPSNNYSSSNNYSTPQNNFYGSTPPIPVYNNPHVGYVPPPQTPHVQNPHSGPSVPTLNHAPGVQPGNYHYQPPQTSYTPPIGAPGHPGSHPSPAPYQPPQPNPVPLSSPVINEGAPKPPSAEAGKRWNDPPPMTAKVAAPKKSFVAPAPIVSPFPNAQPVTAPPVTPPAHPPSYNPTLSYANSFTAHPPSAHQGMPHPSHSSHPAPYGSYGSSTSANAPIPHSHPSLGGAPASTPAPPPPKPDPPKNIPPQYRALVEGMNALCEEGRNKQNPVVKRMVDETLKRIALFADRLRNENISLDIINGVRSIWEFLRVGDFANAQRVHGELITMGSIDDIGPVMVGLKNLINIAKSQ